MSAALNAVYAKAIQQALNAYAGTNSDGVQSIVTSPSKLWLAVVYFAAYEVYQINGLGLLDNFSCSSASVTMNLENDNVLAGSATTTSSGGQALTGGFTWYPTNAAGQIVGDYKSATGGNLQVVDYTGTIHNIKTQVTGNVNSATLSEVQTAPAPSNGGGDYYDDDEVEA